MLFTLASQKELKAAAITEMDFHLHEKSQIILFFFVNNFPNRAKKIF